MCLFFFQLLFTPQNLATGGAAFTFMAEKGARIGVLPRHATSKNEMKWFEVAPCSVFHTANAFEDVDENSNMIITLHACRFPKIKLFDLVDVADEEENQLYEWKLNLNTGEVTEGILCPVFGEFPVVNPKLQGRKYRYVWLARFYKADRTTPRFDGVMKVDTVERRLVSTIEYGAGKFGGECSFVPKKGAQSEDDGYLVGIVHDESTVNTQFYIMDSLDMNVLCRVQLSARVPYGFHGIWVDDSVDPLQSKL
mmetsp:Transcript_10887/g.14180  ORF Transcript_10887/g.14180 Transcript_10887/m.14180 type:complete len:252 (-) Transcript_10887:437-1192(-)